MMKVLSEVSPGHLLQPLLYTNEFLFTTNIGAVPSLGSPQSLPPWRIRGDSIVSSFSHVSCSILEVSGLHFTLYNDRCNSSSWDSDLNFSVLFFHVMIKNSGEYIVSASFQIHHFHIFICYNCLIRRGFFW